MLKKVIKIGDKDVVFRSSATVPRLYRAKFKRDIFKDLAKLESSYKGSKEEGEEFAIDDLEIFENVAYIMAYHADNTLVPFALLRNRSFHPRLGLSDHWYGNGYLDGERKRFCKI